MSQSKLKARNSNQSQLGSHSSDSTFGQYWLTKGLLSFVFYGSETLKLSINFPLTVIPGYPKKGFPEAPGPAGWPSTKPPTAATKPTLQCTEIRSKGNIAACPLGYMVTGCACGMNCGLWNTQNNFSECSCHVSCNDGKPLEWAKAICCRVV